MTYLERWFGFYHAFDHPATVIATAAMAGILLFTPLVLVLLQKLGRVGADHRRELWRRYYSWLVLTPLLLAPVLLGAFWTILGVMILSLACYREFARATGLFREKTISLVVVLGILAITFTVLDNWYALFMAMIPFMIGVIASTAILRDQPKGYIQRVALGVLGFSLFGSCLGHLAFFANDANYRPYLIFVFFTVELNDVFAYIVGKTFGKRKLAPNTSPKKTIAGSLGALVLTTLIVVGAGPSVFRGTQLADPRYLILLGVLISVVGQLGDLMFSSIKRDLEIKDMGVTIPGHGGLLDRFDSIILVAPVAFHYIRYFADIGTGQTQRILTGSWGP